MAFAVYLPGHTPLTLWSPLKNLALLPRFTCGLRLPAGAGSICVAFLFLTRGARCEKRRIKKPRYANSCLAFAGSAPRRASPLALPNRN